MGYVDRNLMSGEQIVYKGQIHWFVFVPGAVLVIAAIVLAAAFRGSEVGPFAGGLALLMGLFSLVKAFILKVSTELAVTSKRVIAKTGLISRNTVELNHNKVESFNIEQSILGRLFGFGTVIVNGTGGGKTPIPSIEAPLDFRRNAMETIDKNQST